jgi:hypothetical protein
MSMLGGDGVDSALLAYSDARTEYTKQLCQTIVPAIMKLFLDMLQESRDATRTEPKKILFHFQTALTDIPDWNMEKVATEVRRLESAIGCEYLEDLITAVFVAHTKILTAIRMNTRQKKIQITVPKLEHFLFKVIIETSKIFWKSTYLFRDDVTNIEKQQNYRQIEGLIHDGVSQAIRCMVPVKSILKDCMASDDVIEDEHADMLETSAVAAHVPVPAPVPVPVPVPVPAPEPEPEPEPDHTISDAAVSEEDTTDAAIISEFVGVTEPIIPSDSEDTDIVEEPITVLNLVENDSDQHVQFAEYKAVYDEDDSELVVDEDDHQFTDFEDLDAPVKDELMPFEDYETLTD